MKREKMVSYTQKMKAPSPNPEAVLEFWALLPLMSRLKLSIAYFVNDIFYTRADVWRVGLHWSPKCLWSKPNGASVGDTLRLATNVNIGITIKRVDSATRARMWCSSGLSLLSLTLHRVATLVPDLIAAARLLLSGVNLQSWKRC